MARHRRLTIKEDADNDGFINRVEAQGATDVKVSFNGNLVNVGDIVKITSAGVTKDVTITATDKANGFVTTDFPQQAGRHDGDRDGRHCGCGR